MESDASLQEEFRTLCTTRCCKFTQQRFAIYSYVKGNRTHPDVNQIWENVRQTVPSITRESVFRILNELADFGVIGRLDKIINARFDGNGTDHGHLICENCGAIFDFELPASLRKLPPFEGFIAKHTELRISGLCAQCAKKQKQQNKE